MTYPAFTVNIIATEVKKEKIKKSIFKLPKDRILIESKF